MVQSKKPSGALIAVVLFMISGPGLVLLNRYFMVEAKFKFPYLLSSIGVISTATTAHVGVANGWLSVRSVSTLSRASGDANPSAFTFFSRRIFPIALCAAIAMCTGNATYLYMGVGFIQMLKAGTPVVVLVMLWLTGIEKISKAIALCVVGMALGMVLSVEGELEPSLTGILLMGVSEMAESGRVVLTQHMLRNLSLTVVEVMYYLSPLMAGTMLCFSALLEGPQISREGALSILMMRPLATSMVVCLGICVNFASFLVIKTTSSLLLKLLVTVRNIGLVAFAVVAYNETVTPMSLVGYATTMIGFSLYSYLKIQEGKAQGPHAVLPTTAKVSPPIKS